MLKDSKVNDQISRDLRSNADKVMAPDKFLAKKKGESVKDDLYDHDKSVVKKKKQDKKPPQRDAIDDQDERQIKSEIDYSDKHSYYAPSVAKSKRSHSSTSNRSQLSKQNLRAAFGAGGKAGEASVTSHARSKSSAYSRPTTSAAMSVVSNGSSSYYSVTESKRSYNTEESIMEGSDEDGEENLSSESEEEGEEKK